ncbi:hypothetical protein FOZ61_007286, partial [Perkinsus olseni]
MDTRFVRLAPEEQAFYDDLAKQYQDKVEQLAEEGMLEAKISELLVLLMRLRQAANSGLLIKFREAMKGRVECVSPGIAQLESECIRQWIGDELSADPVECPACLEQVEITLGT